MNYPSDLIDAYMRSVHEKHVQDIKSRLDTVDKITLDVQELFEFFGEVQKLKDKYDNLSKSLTQMWGGSHDK